jgi:DNA-binding winged helix-turn-helix (wHTH) protein
VSGRVQFGLFELDEASGALTREGTPVRLQPQPARVLARLVEQAGAVVTRDELRQLVWSDGTFVDFERGLNFCIAQIRAALGDSADSPRFIETLPRRGYRFIAPVRRPDTHVPAALPTQRATSPSASSSPSPADTSVHRRRQAWWLTLGVRSLLVALIAGAAVFLARSRPLSGPLRVLHSFGPGAADTLSIAAGAHGLIVKHPSGPERTLFHLGSRVFHPAGAEAVRVRLWGEAGRASTLTVEDGPLVVTALRSD